MYITLTVLAILLYLAVKYLRKPSNSIKCKRSMLKTIFVVSYLIILFVLTVFVARKRVEHTIKYDITSNIVATCSQTSSSISFSTNKDNNKIITINPKLVNMHITTGTPYIEVNAYDIVFSDFAMNLRTIDDSFPKAFWLWPFNLESLEPDENRWSWSWSSGYTHVWISQKQFNKL